MTPTPKSTIARVREDNDIVDVVRAYVRLRRSNARYIGLCPFHNEKTPSFTVNPAGQFFKCFGCGAGGDVLKFLQRIESISFPAALQQLADRAGISLGPPTPTTRQSVQDLRYARQLAWESDQFREWFTQTLEAWRAEEPDTPASLLSWAPWLHRLRTMPPEVLVGLYGGVRRAVPELPAFLRGRAERREAIATVFLEAYWTLDEPGRAIVGAENPSMDMQAMAETAAAILEAMAA